MLWCVLNFTVLGCSVVDMSMSIGLSGCIPQLRAERESSGKWGEIFDSDVVSHTALRFSQLLHLTYNNPCPPSHTLVTSQIRSPFCFTSISFCCFSSSSSFSLSFHLPRPFFILLSSPLFLALSTSSFTCPSLQFYKNLFSLSLSLSSCFPTSTSDQTLYFMSPLGDKAHHPLFASPPQVLLCQYRFQSALLFCLTSVYLSFSSPWYLPSVSSTTSLPPPATMLFHSPFNLSEYPSITRIFSFTSWKYQI